MKTRLLTLALIYSLGLGTTTAVQAQGAKRFKGGGGSDAGKSKENAKAPESGEKKAAAPKTPADLALDEFNKARTEPGAKDQARFQRVIAAGVSFVTQYPTHGQINTVVTNLAFYPDGIDRKLAEQRTSFLSFLKLDVTNGKYKDGVTDPAKTALLAVEATVADYEARQASNPENLSNLREKTDALAEAPGGGGFLTERERSYVHLLALGRAPANAEKHLNVLLNHKEKRVKDMAREELNIFEIKKEPYALTFTALDGKPFDLSQLRGKVVALYFWSSTNKGSVDRLDQLKQIQSVYRKKGFEVVTVSYDKEEDREKLLKSVKENRVTFPVYFDGKQAKNAFSPKLNVYSVPRLYVFDQKGILQTTIQGSPVGRLQPDLPQNQLEGMVKKLLGIK
ncbi:MAG: TlpA family protein disulfide reductase [Opitutus sp.]|nr:TlpA family protein disulfide reductase [Opitutus sp.]